MATNDNILSGDDIMPMLSAAGTGLPNPEWLPTGGTPGTEVAPLLGGRYQQSYPRDKGVKKLARFMAKADVIGAPATLSDVASTEAAYGTNELRYTGGSGTNVYLSNLGAVAPINVTQGSVRFWMRCGPNFFTGGGLKLRFYSAGSPASPSTAYTEVDLFFMRGQVTARDAVSWGRWQKLAVPGPQLQVAPVANNGITNGAGGPADMTAVTYASVVTSMGSSVQIAFGDIEYVPNPRTKGAVIFTFDDGHISQFTYAALEMAKRGFPGVAFVGTPAVDINRTGRMSAQQLRILQDVHGWQIGSQSWKTEDATTYRAMTAAERTAEFGKLRNWHNSIGLMGGQDGSYFSSYGQDSVDLFDSVRQHFRTLRTYGGANPAGQPGMHYGECAPFGDQYSLRAMNFASSRYNVASAYVNDLKAMVDQAATNKAVLISAYHDELGSAGQHRTNFTDMLDDLYGRTDVEVLTIDEYIRSWS